MVVGLTMKTMLPKVSKAMDMHFQLLKYHHAQQLIHFFGQEASLIVLTTPSKHHLPAHHIKMCSQYVHDIIPAQ